MSVMSNTITAASSSDTIPPTNDSSLNIIMISFDHALSLIPPLVLLFFIFIYLPWMILQTIVTIIRKVMRKLMMRPTAATTETSNDVRKKQKQPNNNHQFKTLRLFVMAYIVSSFIDDYYHHYLTESTSKSRHQGRLEGPIGGSGNNSHNNNILHEQKSYNDDSKIDSHHHNNHNPNHNHNLYDLIQGYNTNQLQQVLQRVPRLLRGPMTPPWWSILIGISSNRHLQFIPWLLQNEFLHLRTTPILFQTITMNVTGCLDKSIPNCIPHPLMEDIITLDIFPPFEKEETESSTSCSSTSSTSNSSSNSSKYSNFNLSSPIIVFAPGLSCHSQDMPGNSIIRRAYGDGFRSIVVNRRGHTRNLKLRAPRFSILGDVDDMEQVYWYIMNTVLPNYTTTTTTTNPSESSETSSSSPPRSPPMFLHGISAGTAITVSGLSKWDKRNREEKQRQAQEQQLSREEEEDVDFSLSQSRPAPKFLGHVAVTPGYDCTKVFLPERFQFPYNDILTQTITYHFVTQNEDVLRAYNSSAVDAALKATQLQELVDAVVPFAGYPTSSIYYEDTNPITEIRDISTPTLVLNSRDDPCCRIDNLYEQSPYPNHNSKTFAQMAREAPNALIAVTHKGSHCPFLDTSTGDGGGEGDGGSSLSSSWFPFIRDPLTGGWMLNSWADQVSIDYYRAVLEVYGKEEEEEEEDRER